MQPYAKFTKIHKQNTLAILDPSKHYVINLVTSNDARAISSTVTRFNPLFISPNDKILGSDTEPLGDPPAAVEHEGASMLDESDDSDYTAESGDEEADLSESTGSLDEEDDMDFEQQVDVLEK